MHNAFPGLGTVINVATIVIGSLAGMAVGHRLPERTRRVVTDCLGLTTLLMAAMSALAVRDPSLTSAVGVGAPVLIVLGSLLIGGIAGSLLRIEGRLEDLAGVIQTRLARRPQSEVLGELGAGVEGVNQRRLAPRPQLVGAKDSSQGFEARERFIEGWLSASLLFCVGPLTILGSLSDGMGKGIDQLSLKAVLDGFAAVAFASSFGVGVLLSAVSVAAVQGLLTLVGVLLGSMLPAADVAALTATGGLLLVGISLRLLRIREIPVGDLLPALIVAPLLTEVVVLLR
jgi:uncharacterized membrane protein YqgA involved in biofilm formation